MPQNARRGAYNTDFHYRVPTVVIIMKDKNPTFEAKKLVSVHTHTVGYVTCVFHTFQKPFHGKRRLYNHMNGNPIEDPQNEINFEKD